MKRKEIIFNGKFFMVASNLHEKIQEHLDNKYSDKINVKDTFMNSENNTITLIIQREGINFQKQQEGYLSLDDLILISGLPINPSLYQPLPRITFSNMYNYSMSIKDVVEEYNNVVKTHHKLAELLIDSTPEQVIFIYKFRN